MKMEKEVEQAIKELCDQVKIWADCKRNISMESFKNSHLMVNLRRLIGEEEFLE